MKKLFASLIAVLFIGILVYTVSHRPEKTTVASWGPYTLEMSDFSCAGDCSMTNVIVNGIVAEQHCPTCTEVVIWANFDGAKETIGISGYEIENGIQRTLKTQSIKLKDHPNWENESFRVETSGGTVNVHLSEAPENLVSNITCEGTCDHMNVGTHGKVFFRNCPPEPCTTIEISHDGIEVGVDYTVQAWQQAPVFGNDNSPTVLIEKTFALDKEPLPLHFKETLAGHEISFTLSENR